MCTVNHDHTQFNTTPQNVTVHFIQQTFECKNFWSSGVKSVGDLKGVGL